MNISEATLSEFIEQLPLVKEAIAERYEKIVHLNDKLIISKNSLHG